MSVQLDEEERTVEITINLDKPLVFIILLFIIILQSGYIGYLVYFQEQEASESPLEDNEFFLELEASELASEDDEIKFDLLEEPETTEELREDLLSVGCQHVVELEVDDMRGKHLEVSYSEALRLAREAAFVGVNEDILGFILYLDGDHYIWFAS